MSRITDAIDNPGNVEVPSAGPSGVVATDLADVARAVAELREGHGLAAAARAGLEGATDVVLVGFSAKTAEPFALGPGPLAEIFESASALLAGHAIEGERDPLWAGHRGHAVWLHPGSIDSARLFLALRLSEALGPARALDNPRGILEVASSAIEDVSGLDAALEPEIFESLVAKADSAEPGPVPRDVGHSRAIVVFDGFGGALVAAASGLALPIGLVDRGGRPFLLPLRPAAPGAFLDLLHRAIDLDSEGPLAATQGVRLDPGGDPEMVGFGELVIVG